MKAIIKSNKPTVIRAKAAPTDSPISTGARRNRESYLEGATEAFRELFKRKANVAVPTVRLSCGFPMGLRGSKKFAGQTWAAKAATDSVAQVFISPLIDHTATVLCVLAHELIHAAVGTDEKHGPLFRRVARDIGFRGSLLNVSTASDELLDWIKNDVVPTLGEYPHAKLNLTQEAREKSGITTQGTRLFKCVCPKSGYTVRTTRTWLDKHGAPLSPVTKKPMRIDGYTPVATAAAA